MASAAGLCAGGYAINSLAAEPQSPLPEEDGYRLWLRYAPPGEIAKRYRRIVRRIQVEGTSATCGIIRDEFPSEKVPGTADCENATAVFASLIW